MLYKKNLSVTEIYRLEYFVLLNIVGCSVYWSIMANFQRLQCPKLPST